MSSDSARERESELIAFKSSGESTRAKRRTVSERRKRARGRPKQRTSQGEKLERPPSSVDSGAGGEDEGSASDDDSDRRLKGRRARFSRPNSSSDDRTRQSRPLHLSSNNNKHHRKSGGKQTNSVFLSANSVSDKVDRRLSPGSRANQNCSHTTTSDSAISTSALSTSTLLTSTESPLRSSPNLSDRSKQSSSSPLRTRFPEFSRALRRKQERIKRQLDLRETRSRLERLQFIERTYESKRMMVLTSTLSRRRQLSRSAGSQRSRPSSSSQSFPVGKESRRSSASRGEPSQADTTAAAPEVRGFQKGERSHSGMKEVQPSCKSKHAEAAGQDRVMSDESVIPTTSASSPRHENSRPAQHTLSHASSNEDIAAVNSKNMQSSKPRSSAASHDSQGRPDTSGEDRTRSRSSRREGRSRKKHHRDSSQKEDVRSKSDSAQSRLALAIPNGEPSHGESDGGSASRNRSHSGSPRVNDDFEKLAQRLESSPRVSSNAEQVEARMSHTMDAILRDGLPEMPSLDEITEKGLVDWRAVFRVEMMRLRREVNEFRIFCHQQVELHALAVEKSWNGPGTQGKDQTPEPSHRDAPKVTEQLKDLEVNMKLFQRRQKLLDQETELLDKEEQLADKVKHLEEYEKEILEVESMLNQRQAICDRRQRALVNLDEELQALRQELEDTKEQINSDGSIPESNSERARKNWDMVRRNLMDKQQLLETTVQKYRSELAAATSTIAGKDILISRLQSTAMHHEEELASRDKRIHQLESKLSLALTETRTLTEQLSGSSHRDSTMSLFGSELQQQQQQHQHALGTAASSHRRPSHDANFGSETNHRVSFRSSSAYYRRPSSNAGSELGSDDYVTKSHNGSVGGGDGHGGGGMGGDRSNGGSRMSRKRNSVSDNAISRLTLTTPRSDDKFGRGSSACSVQ